LSLIRSKIDWKRIDWKKRVLSWRKISGGVQPA
jgi:hypothetical protein